MDPGLSEVNCGVAMPLGVMQLAQVERRLCLVERLAANRNAAQ